MKKLAFIGCGNMGSVHVEHVLAIKDLEFKIVGFCDLIERKAQNFADWAGQGRVYTDYRELYRIEQPDMVIIAVPPYAHGTLELDTAEHGIHMLVEKPLGLDMSTVREIKQSIDEHQVMAAVGLQCRYDDKLNQFISQFIEEHPITFVDVTRFGGVPDMPWFRQDELSGGQLLEQSIHEIDILRYFLGEVESVYSLARRGVIGQQEWPSYDTNDITSSLLKFKSGLIATFTCGLVSLEAPAWESKIILGSRDARCEFLDGEYATVFGLREEDKAEQLRHTVEGDGTMRVSKNELGITQETEWQYDYLSNHSFIKAVIENKPELIKSPYIEGMKSMRICLASKESLRTGKPILVDDI